MRDKPQNAFTDVQVLSSLAKDLGFRANGFGGPRQQAVDDSRYSQMIFRPDVVPPFIGFVRVGRSRNQEAFWEAEAALHVGKRTESPYACLPIPAPNCQRCDAATSLLYSFLDQTKGAQSPYLEVSMR